MRVAHLFALGLAACSAASANARNELEPSADAGSTGHDAGACGAHDLGDALPAAAHGSLAGAADALHPPCGPALPLLPDVAYRWSAPRAGTFTVGLTSDGFADFAVGSGDCPGDWPLACNPAGTAFPLTLAAGDTITIVVTGDAAAFDVAVTAVPDELGLCSDGIDNDGDGLVDCADPDCAPDAAEVDLDAAFPIDVTAAAPTVSHSARSCTDPTVRDPRPGRVYRWTPPTTGRYAIRASGAASVGVYTATCPETGIACADSGAELAPLLTGGVPVLLVADADSPYRLEIGENASCADVDLGSALPARASGSLDGASEKTFRFAAPAAGTYRVADAAAVNNDAIVLHTDSCVGPFAGTSGGEPDLPPHWDVELAAGQELFISALAETPGRRYDLSVTLLP